MVLLGLPAGVLRLLHMSGGGVHLGPGLEVLVFGVGIISAAFLIAWAAEAAQKDISQTLALAFLAFIAVLPEYSVDLYLAWQAGQDPTGPYVHYATANMTGANRLLVGFGWPLVALLFWLKQRRSVYFERGIAPEILFLGIATVYALIIPFKGNIALYDGVFLIALFGVYIWLAGKTERLEPELIGPAATVGNLSVKRRRTALVLMFGFAATVILASAEPFAEGLLNLGTSAGIDQFLMIQWVAPLASETPEILVAVIFAVRGQAAAAMTTLISAKVNQWTLLVGTLPFVYSLSLGDATGLPLDPRQAEEVWLTAGQSLFAVAILMNRTLGLYSSLALAVLWGSQLGVAGATARWGYVGGYLGLAVFLMAVDRNRRRSAGRLVPDVLSIWRTSKEAGHSGTEEPKKVQ